MKRFALAACLLSLWSGSAFTASNLCATPEQAGAVRALYAVSPVPPTFMAAGKLMLPEGANPKPALVAQFEKTRALIAGWPRVCN